MFSSLKSLVVNSSLLVLFFAPTTFNMVSARGADLRAGGYDSHGASFDAGYSDSGVGVGGWSGDQGGWGADHQGAYYSHDNFSGDQGGWNNAPYYAQDERYDDGRFQGTHQWQANNQWQSYPAGSTYSSYPNQNTHYNNQPGPYGQYYQDSRGTGAGVYYNVR